MLLLVAKIFSVSIVGSLSVPAMMLVLSKFGLFPKIEFSQTTGLIEQTIIRPPAKVTVSVYIGVKATESIDTSTLNTEHIYHFQGSATNRLKIENSYSPGSVIQKVELGLTG